MFSGSKGSSYERQSDNLFTTDVVEAVLGISEGPIKGLKDGPKSFYLGDTPLVGVDGETNFDSFQLKPYLGNELGEPIKSLLGGFGSSTTVGTSLEQNISVVRSGTHTDIDYLDIRLQISALVRGSKKGEFSHSGVVKLEYKRASSATWLPIPSLVSLSDRSLPLLRSRNDLKVIVKAAPAPALSDPAEVWLNVSDNYKPMVRNAAKTAWVAGSSSIYKSWVSERAPFWIADAEVAPQKHHYWINTRKDEVKYFNGDNWVSLGSSTQTAAVTSTYQLTDGMVRISGKTTTGAVQEYRVPVERLANDTYDLRVTVVDGNRESGSNVDRFDVTWESFQEITARAFNFPGLAVTQIAGRSSDQFSSLPELTGIYEGRIVRVPSNYDPVARTYNGVWNGAWKIAYTNNPAFVGYDLVMNDRYGVNAYYPLNLSKWDVYEAGKFCDIRTADGSPRFTFNGLIDSPLNGRDAINYIFGIFGGRFFDDGNGEAVIRLDAPTNPVAVFGPENVIDGLFTYTFAGVSTQYNDITVTFINPDLNWKEDRRRVFDQAHINKFGRIPKSIAAIGATNVSEAIRRGRYYLATSLSEKTSVSFKTNRQATFLTPYDIILVTDEELGYGKGGRVVSFNRTNRTFTFRDPIFLEAGVSYTVTFTIPTPDKNFITFPLQINANQGGTARTSLKVVGDLPAEITEDMVFTIGMVGTNAAPKPFRIISISPDADNEDLQTINAIEVNRLKWDYIDGLIPNIPVDVTGSAGNAAPLPVASFEVLASTVEGRKVFTLVWQPSPSKNVTTYRIMSSRNGDPFELLGETSGKVFVLPNMLAGDYLFSIAPINNRGVEGATRYIHFDALPADVIDLPLLTGLSATAVTALAPDGAFFAYVQAAWPEVKASGQVTYEVGYRKVSDSIMRRVETTELGFRTPHLEGNNSYVIEVGARVGNIPLRAPASVTLLVPGDDTIPGQPTGWAGTPGYRQITLSGNPSAESDFKEFIIYGATASSGPFTQIATSASPSYIRGDITASDPMQYYRIAQRDRSGNVSPQTATITVKPKTSIKDIETDAPTKPTGLVLTSTPGELVATWTANPETDVVQYHVEITEGAGNPVVFNAPSNRYTWKVTPNVAFSVRVRAVNQMLWTSPWSDPKTLTSARDTVAPARPPAPTIKMGFGTLWATWTANTEADLARYEVYVSQTSTAPVAGTEASYKIAANTLTLTGLAEAQIYYLWVRAVDTSDNKSAWSPVASGTTSSIWQTQDDPLIPTGLGGTNNLGSYEATWNTSTNSISYELGVIEGTGNEVVLPAGSNRLTIRTIPGITYALRVRGVNRIGSRSGWSPTVNITAVLDTTPPATPQTPVVKPGFKTLWIEWPRNTEADLAYYDVAMHTATFTVANAATYFVGQVTANTLAIVDLPDNATRYFRIRAIDTSGNASPWTGTIVSGTTSASIDPTITTEKLAGLIDNSSLKTGVELLTLWTGAALPATRQTANISWNGKLYRWNGAAYVPLADYSDLKFENITGKVSLPMIGTDLSDHIALQGKTAISQVLRTFPSDFSGNGQFWTRNRPGTEDSGVGLPVQVIYDAATGIISFPAATTTGTNAVLTRGVMPYVEGHTIRVTASVRAVGGNTPDLLWAIVAPLTNAYAVAPGGDLGRISMVPTVQGEFVTMSADIVLPAPPTDAAYIRSGLVQRANIAGKHDLDVQWLLIEDVTAQVKAAAAARASLDTAELVYAAKDETSELVTAASGHAGTASGAAGVATTKAGEAAKSATDADGAKVAAESFSQLAAVALSGGMAKNPTFVKWTGAQPENVTFSASPNGTFAKVPGKYGNAVEIDTTVAAIGPVVQMDVSTGQLSGKPNAEKMLVTVEVEPVSGNTAGIAVLGTWITGGTWRTAAKAFGTKLTLGSIQTYQFILERPAGAETANNFSLRFFGSNNSDGAVPSIGKVRLHRLDVQAVAADSYVDQQSKTKATVDGLSESAYVMRVKAGGAAAGFEMVAASDPKNGAASSIRMTADEILLNGSVKTPHLDSGAVTTRTLAVGFGGQLLNNVLFASGTKSWLLSGTGTSYTQTTLSVRSAGTDWSGRDFPVLQIMQNGAATAGSSDLLNLPIKDDTGAYGYGYPVKPDDWLEVSAQLSLHRCTGELYIEWVKEDGTVVGVSVPTVLPNTQGPAGSTTNPDLWPRYWVKSIAPTGAAFGHLKLRKFGTLSGTNSYIFIHKPMKAISSLYRTEPTPFAPDAFTYIDGGQMITDSIGARSIKVLELMARIGTFETAFVKDAHIVELSAATLKAGTALAGTITVAGDTLGTIRDRANDPAARINQANTQIDPGKITITGTTTLANWRYGPDQTRIDGGMLGTNSVLTNSLQVGLRNVMLTGIVFEHNKPATNRVSWTAGSIVWVNDDGVLTTTAITAGNAPASSVLRYIYWVKGATTLSITTDVAVAKGANAVTLATYEGGIKLSAWVGRTIIDGGNIKTETIDATHMVKTAAVITESAQIKSAIVNDAHILELSAAKLKSGTSLSGSITVNGRALTSLGAAALLDVVDENWISAGAGVVTYPAGGVYVTGARYLRVTGGQATVKPVDLFQYDPSKLHRVTFRVRRISGTNGKMFLGFSGFKSDRTTKVISDGTVGVNDLWLVAGNVDQSAISTSFIEYVTYLKGANAEGTPVTGGGTIANPRTVPITANFLQPVAIFNYDGGTADMALDLVKIEVVEESVGELVNAGNTQIDPGKITITGTTTLADWRKGGDETKIDGGKLSANTVETNSLKVGQRGITLTGIQFEHNNPSVNRVSWTGGWLRWINDAGATVSSKVNAGNALWTTGALFIYWTKGDNDVVLRTTTNLAVALADNNVCLASYEGGTLLDADYGRTVVDGGNIKTNTVTAAQLIKTASLITNKAQLGDAVVDTLAVAGKAITAPAFSSGAVAGLTMNYVLTGPAGETYSVFILGTLVQTVYAFMQIKVNGQIVCRERPSAGTLGTMAAVLNLAPGTHVIEIYSDDNANINRTTIFALATKR